MDTPIACLWFDGNAEEAATFYVETFPNSHIKDIARYQEGGPMPAGTVLTVNLDINGAPFCALNGGPQFTFTEAVSFQVMCQDQAEVDRVWEALTANGGEEGPCGWCKDKFGLSWQVIPKGMLDLMNSTEAGHAARATEAMLKMTKLDLATMEAAARG